MKARKYKSRKEENSKNHFLYAELLQCWNPDAIGLVIKFIPSKTNTTVTGRIVKTKAHNFPVSKMMGFWSNPEMSYLNWKVLPNYQETP